MGRRKKFSSLSKQLDEETTAANAEDVLLYYQQAKRGMIRESLQSPQFDGMPKSPSVDNHVESGIVNRVSDEEFVLRCNKILQCIESERSRDIIKYTYMGPILTDQQIMDKPSVAVASTRYYECKREALLTFAAMWPPFPSSLEVYV